MVIVGLSVGFALSALLISIGASAVSFYALADVKGFRSSTHQIQYMPVDQVVNPPAEQATLDKVMAEHDKKVYDNLEAFYPGKEEVV